MSAPGGDPRRVVLASGNPGKLRELEALLAGTGLEAVAQSAFAVPAVDETGATFVENALIKARNAAAASGLPAIADDSGLVVDALGGAPGVRTARFAGPGAGDAENVAALLDALRGVPPGSRTARFVSVVVYLRAPADPTPIVCEADWPGRILEAARGAGGFGYDPVFEVPGRGVSAAELPAAVKNALSHRGRAMAALAERLRGQPAAAGPPGARCYTDRP